MNDLDYIKQELNHYGQAHLLNFWDDLNQTQQVNLLTEIKNLNLKEVTQYFADANQSLKAANDKIDDLLEPLPAAVCGSVTRCSVQQIHDYYKLGKEMQCLYSCSFYGNYFRFYHDFHHKPSKNNQCIIHSTFVFYLKII